MQFLKRYRSGIQWVVTSGILLGWFAFAYWMLSKVWSCNDSPSESKLPIWDGHLHCMEANELGDLLAGVFAPAAFILLAVTVVMQARELRAQRQELEETREVFSAQNKLIGAQTEAAIKSANLFAAQNAMLEAQEAARLAEAKNFEFMGLLRRIETIIRTRLADRLPLTQNGAQTISMFSQPMRLPDECIAAIGTAVDNALYAAHSFEPGSVRVYDKYGHLQAFQSLIGLSRRAEEMANSLGQDHEGIVSEIRLAEFAKLLESYIRNGVVAGVR